MVVLRVLRDFRSARFGDLVEGRLLTVGAQRFADELLAMADRLVEVYESPPPAPVAPPATEPEPAPVPPEPELKPCEPAVKRGKRGRKR